METRFFIESTPQRLAQQEVEEDTTPSPRRT